MSKRLALVSVCLLALSGCKFQIEYPDSFAVPDLGKQDSGGQDGLVPDVVGPDGGVPDSTLPDIEPTFCTLDADCKELLGVPPKCQQWACVNQQCEYQAAKEGTQCNDGNACTVEDRCVAGNCGGEAACNDGDPCTLDQCDSQNGNCTWAPDPTCSGCVEEGEKVKFEELCCDGLVPVSVCGTGPGCGDDGSWPCPTHCCDGISKVCIREKDGFCTIPWETACNSQDCVATTDECTPMGGYCVEGVFAEPAGTQGPCGSGYVVSAYSCQIGNTVCCAPNEECIPTGSSGSNSGWCCDAQAIAVPADLAWLGGGTEPASGTPCETSTTQVFCTYCGDGTCTDGETSCNCDMDCTECSTSGDCPLASTCVNSSCVKCSMEQCSTGLDEDCDGMMDEGPCQNQMCPYDSTYYLDSPFQLVASQPTAYEGVMVAVVGWSKSGQAVCQGTPTVCSADLRLIDHDGLVPPLPLKGGGPGVTVPVGCSGATMGSMLCSPFALGMHVVVWGKVVSDGGVMKLQYHGHCQQDILKKN